MKEGWRATIAWSERLSGQICPGDMQSVIRELLKAVRILGESNDALEARVKELEGKPQRPTAYERVLGG